jgi:outer membrane protein TolC
MTRERDGRGRAARPGATCQRQAGAADGPESVEAIAAEFGAQPGHEPGHAAGACRAAQLSGLETAGIETLVAAALLARADYLSLASQRQGLVEQQRASRARFYPRLSINGNFGEIGRSIGGVQTTGLIQGQIDFTVFRSRPQRRGAGAGQPREAHRRSDRRSAPRHR